MRLLAALLLATVAVAAQPAKRVTALLQRSPEAKQSFWGIHVVDLTTGRPVYSLNSDKLFIPASNTKLFSTALALSRLGPDHRFKTRLYMNAAPDGDGRVQELRLVGGGDPNLSARILPYQREGKKDSAFEVLERFADEAVAKGIRRVEGDIIGDDTAYIWEPFPAGWTADDAIWEYGAAVSALTLNDNAFQLTIDPGTSEGAPATIAVWPPLEYLIVQNRTRTTATPARRVDIDRLPGSTELVVSGDIALGAETRENLVAVGDPALFAAHALRDALIRKGIQVEGVARARHRLPDDPAAEPTGVEIAANESAPLIEALRVVNKESQNLHAEIVLREVARAKEGVGSRRTGLNELDKLLAEAKVESSGYYLTDGSGLSRQNLITPKTTTSLLAFMHSSPHGEAWVETLPIGGIDGTLYNRFDKKPRPDVRAKTGTISHVSALAGYLLRKDGRRYAFAIMANNYASPSADVRKLIDRIVLEFLK